ncbi:protein of unknown function [Pseudorhizobium banfieldiae]|uniref:Uncharacterized protein n=1 Tax=Pseudorhizobium banfieldiae TaxID=1125847 RepID=L0NI54_9HYPH|nr:protein of unknown function [Pseudorhizobium banfieldiae]
MISLRGCRAKKHEAQGETGNRDEKPSSLKDAVFHDDLRVRRCVGAATDCWGLPFRRIASLGPLRGTIRPRSDFFGPRPEALPNLIGTITPEMQRRREHLRKTSKHCVPREGELMDVEEEVEKGGVLCRRARNAVCGPAGFATKRNPPKRVRKTRYAPS